MGRLETSYLPDGYVLHIGVVGVVIDVVLMIAFCVPEDSERRYLGSNWLSVFARFVHICDVLFYHLLFLCIAVESNGTVLGALVRALAVDLRRVSLRFKVYLEQ